MKTRIEIYSVSDSKGVTGYGATVHFRNGRGEGYEEFYFKGRCPTESEVRQAFKRRMETED